MTLGRKIIGRRVYLSPLDILGFDAYAAWLNDIDTYVYLDGSTQLINLETEKAFLNNAQKNGDQFFAIRLIDDNILIGSCGLIKIDHINRKAELSRLFIGDKAYLNQGLGSEAIVILLDYGFKVLNLNNISVFCCSYNHRAFKSYIKCGFKTAGCFRQAKIINGVKYDEIILDIIAEEFSGSPFGTKLAGLLST
ncbi:MAG: GNAT family protein [Syntrophomonas sp.]